MKPTYRFYSFVAGLYLSPLQRGLQTAHAVSEMHAVLLNKDSGEVSPERAAFNDWALEDRTIVILDALNSAGVIDAYTKATAFADFFNLPVVMFSEDTQSLNNATTAAGIIVPDYIFDAKKKTVKNSFVRRLLGRKPRTIYTYVQDEKTYDYELGFEAGDFCHFLKSYRLAQS